MSKQPRVTLKSYFEVGDFPTQQQFADLIDSLLNELEDLPIGIAGGGTGAPTASVARKNLGIKKASAASSLGGVAGFAGFNRAYRIPLSSGSGGADGYQLQVLVGESSGSTGVDLHIDDSSQDFPSGENVGGDFKFVKADGTVVPFFVERVTGTAPNRVAVIWVALPNGTAADIIFLLVDNSIGIANQSNSGLVFPAFYDSFPGTALDTNLWTVVSSTGLTVSNGSMRHTNTNALVRSNAAFSSPGIILEMLWNGVSRAAGGNIVGGFGNATALSTNAIGYLWHPGQDYIRNNSSWVGQGSTLAANTDILTRMTLTGSAFLSFVAIRHENYLTGASLYSRTFFNSVSGENIFMGRRFDSTTDSRVQDISWRWVRIRQQGTAPTIGTITEV